MNSTKLILRTLRHYPWSHLATSAGIAVATAIICGALIIGYSLTRSLEQIVEYRLGNITHTITAGERLFTGQLVYNIAQKEGLDITPILKADAIVSVQGSDARINRVQIWGVDTGFAEIAGGEWPQKEIEQGEVLVSENVAMRLGVATGDFILLRMRTINPIPGNTPFVSDAGQTVTRRVQVRDVLSRHQLGHFNMQSSQTAPFNIFVNLPWLQDVMELDDKVNLAMLASAGDATWTEIADVLQKNLSSEDLGLNLDLTKDDYYWKLTANRVFIDDYLGGQILDVFPESRAFLTYFANSLSIRENNTPYSFVSAVSDHAFIKTPGDMAINQWLADDLGARVGDTLLMRYFVVGPLRELEEKEEKFRITAIVSMDEAMNDSILMPHLPGLSDAGSCRDWDTGIPIDLDLIRQKDEDYWDTYRGTPKAWISLEKGQQLWQNRFGNLTTVLISAENFDRVKIDQMIVEHVDPFILEFRINPVKEQGLTAARGGVDFGQLFAGLGMFIIISGLLLTVLLVQFNLKRREGQVQLFASLGFSKTLIRKIILAENLVVVGLGSLVGAGLSVLYTRLVFSGLNRIWFDIVRTDVLQLHFNGLNLAAGLLIGIVLGMVAVYWGIGKIVRESISGKNENHKTRNGNRDWSKPIAPLVSVATVFMGIYAALFAGATGLFAWLTAGIFMLLSILMWLFRGLKPETRAVGTHLQPGILAWKNLTRNPLRSFTILILLALGSFVIVVTAANYKDMAINPSDRSGGTGGFHYMAETTVPFLQNLNDTDVRYDLNIPDELEVIQFLSVFADDASCHNLNRVANPRILATDPAELTGRFAFVAGHRLLNREDPWQSLEEDHPGFIPAIADQSVILWGLGKSVGDTLYYTNSRGEEIRLLLIGGLENSVLQGNVVISVRHFFQHFPGSDGSGVFLLEAGTHEPQELENELAFVFRDYGWEMVSTVDKLAGFNSVENTYLQIFFLMGALGMLLGTIGLAIVIARSMLERRAETSLFSALGFSGTLIRRIYFTEYTLLFVAGLLAGTLSALVATMPTWLADSQNVSPGFLAGVLAIILVNGLFWIWLIPGVMLRKRDVVPAMVE
jgi:putative ABC transport system permease protein